MWKKVQDMDELYDMNCEAFLTGFKGLQVHG